MEKAIKRENDLCERFFKFTVSVIKLLRTINNSPEITVMKYQLAKSSSSSGANYEESTSCIIQG